MKMSCISIQLDQNEPIVVALNNLGYLHVVGVAGGNVMVMAGSPEKNGAFTSHKWPELPITDSSQLSIYLGVCGESTTPSVSQSQTISELEKRLKETSEKLKHFEERVSEELKAANSPGVNRQRISSVQVLREAESVFAVSGEHVQFEINWKANEEPKISVWALESYEKETPKDHFVSELNSEEKYVLRFGS